MSMKSFKQGIALDLEMALKRNCPVDTGRLKFSIHINIKDNVLEISLLEYAMFLEYGTAAHFIKPVNKKALHWKDSGKDAFSKGHWVSGIEANPFIRNTFYHELPKIVERNARLHLDGAEVEVTFT